MNDAGTDGIGSYDLMDVERRLCDDDAIAELGVHLEQQDGRVVVSGAVAAQERRDRVLARVREELPGVEVVDRMTVADDLSRPPTHREEVQPS